MRHYEIDHIVSFEVIEDKKGINITEMCDYYYSTTFNKEEFKLIIDELTKLYEEIT
jgi:hypothetical protein